MKSDSNVHIKIVKQSEPKSPERHMREHEIGMFRHWCEIKYRHVFDEMARKLGYQKPKDGDMKAAA